MSGVRESLVAEDLYDLTERLAKGGVDISSGFLGGEFGYGAWFENDVFMMHPYCWCERADCPWCLACECEVEQIGGLFVTVQKCDNCAVDDRTAAPNFLHKPSGTEVRWYKYIGRSMEVDLRADWRALFAQCLASIAPAPVRPVRDAGDEEGVS